MDTVPENNANSPSEPHQMRITSHGKMHDFVEFALNHFKNNSDVPLTLHTLPATKMITVERVEVPKAQDAPDSKDTKERGISLSTTTIPRLISVVEIIKREYLKTLEMTRSNVLSGLHQYNEIGYLEQETEGSVPSGWDRTQALAMVLEGKNYPKEKKSAYMRVTLSKNELPHLIAKGATCQPPSIRKLSKSARARARKRQRKSYAEEDAELIT
jgi:hypothetical protein